MKNETKFYFQLIGFVILFTNPFLCAQTSEQWQDYRFQVMGTEARVRLWHEDEKVAKTAIREVEKEMHRINDSMSPFIETSELSIINKLGASKKFSISKELFDLLEKAQKISEMTEGAFDISFSSVGYLYDYRKREQPNDELIKNKLPLINYKQIKLDKTYSSIKFLQTGMKIDLGGIAKGHAVDNCISILRKLGVEEALITAGGDTFALGDNAGKLWKVGVRHPRAESKVVTLLPVANEAVSTSGDYERFFLDGDERVHHIINPKTGKSALEVQSVTIIAANSTFADALSTSVFVLGVTKGLSLVESLEDVSVIIVDNKGKLFYSSDLLSPQ